MSETQRACVFLSHSSHDDAVVARIRRALLDCGVDVWDDARQLAPGDDLDPEIADAIDSARHFVAVLSLPHAVNSAWVRKEVRRALARKARGDGYKVIPILLDGLEPTALGLWFDDEPVAVKLQVGPGGIEEALPDLLAALELELPTDREPPLEPEAPAYADLTLRLSEPRIESSGDGKRRAAANARLVYRPLAGTDGIETHAMRFVSPLGPIEADDLSFYLERYFRWPTGSFEARARTVESRLPDWGRLLYDALPRDGEGDALEAWRNAPDGVERRFSVLVDRAPAPVPPGVAPEDAQRLSTEADEAATLLLALPWELLHDPAGYLFHGARGVRVRRRIPFHTKRLLDVTQPPLRVLLVSPRPEDDQTPYIDHRSSARPLVDALLALGELAHFQVLSPPTFPALEAELRRAWEAKTPYHVVHFDGHGVYERRHGLGALVFEHPDDALLPGQRRSVLVDGDTLAKSLRDLRVGLFFLDACQTAQAEADPTASVAGKLLAGGVGSVVAMSHSVLVETARRFVTAFYSEITQGRRVGRAMLEGQLALQRDTRRGKGFHGDLHLHDWFVPVLYQEELDPQLVTRIHAVKTRAAIETRRAGALGTLPAEPAHGFVGRSHELLAAERTLATRRHVVLLGEGGEGKTTLATELARWLVRSGRFERAAFVSLERSQGPRAVLHAIGDEVVVGFASHAGQDEKQARLLVERALRERPTVVVIDNVESALPPPAEASLGLPDDVRGLLEMLRALGALGETRVVFTSREALPEPFASGLIAIGRLERGEAIDLVSRVLRQTGDAPRAGDEGGSEDEVAALVDAVGCHARALVVLSREVGSAGVRATTQDVAQVMARLHARFPGDRERSLYASVELSLRRLPPAMRARIRPLGVFQGGANVAAIGMVLGIEKPEEAGALGDALVAVGLAESVAYGHLRFDPALAPLLLSELSEAEWDDARTRWARATAAMARFLYQQQSKHAQMARTLASLDLPNLLGALEHLAGKEPPEAVIEVATSIEALVAPLGQPRDLTRATSVREAVAARLGEWGHELFVVAGQSIDRFLDQGRWSEAITVAEGVLTRATSAGEAAYPEAAYDVAVALFRLGRALRLSGDAGAALAPLAEARRRFQTLADAGGRAASEMAAKVLADQGDCQQALGRLDEAARAYEQAIQQAHERQDRRGEAVGKGQMGTIRLLQRSYPEALATWHEARVTFERLGEPGTVAAAWHQIGAVHQGAGQHDQAEKAYLASLRISVQGGNRSGEATTLLQVGTLYSRIGRREEAVRFYRQAAEAYNELRDLAGEGRTHGNLASELRRLGRHDEARSEILRAIECLSPFGHAAEPWKAHAILHQIERAAGNAAAAGEARMRAVEAYLAYRRDGGQNQTAYRQIFAMVAAAIAANDAASARAQLEALARQPELPAYLGALLPKLTALLDGSRDPALAADPALDYDDTAELTLLLEQLPVVPRKPGS